MKKRWILPIIMAVLVVKCAVNAPKPFSEQPISQIEALAKKNLERDLGVLTKPVYGPLATYRRGEGAVVCGEVAYVGPGNAGGGTQRFIVMLNGPASTGTIILEKPRSPINPNAPMTYKELFDGSFMGMCRH